jgi:hypothetical protein
LYFVDSVWIYDVAIYSSDTALLCVSMDDLHKWQYDYCDVDVGWWMGNSAINDKISFDQE